MRPAPRPNHFQMPYTLQPLLRIRMMREDRASGELTAARRAVAVAEDALAARKRDLAAYEETKEERRDRIYAAIIGQTISREKLDLASEGVARIDEEGVVKADNVRQAEAEVERRMEAAEVAKAAFNLATKNRMKIEEHKAVWLDEDAKAQEARAEGELEDFTVRKEEI